ncbi:MAG: GNAT family N-acetyltransferase [Patescibacteria group bacterium]|nr:GNAT family N-acetyltransferase [Patescibacteria group bacterium]
MLVTIRAVSSRDLSAIVQVAMACFPQDYGERKWAEAWHRGALSANPKTQYFVAETDGNIAGYISWSFIGGFQAGVIELEQLGVSPDFQGQGIGTKLINESLPQVQAWLKKNIGRELHAVKVDTATSNEAQRLYRKTLGAEVEATLKDFLYGNDEVIMIRRFNQKL